MLAALVLATALLTNARINDPAQVAAGQPDITPAVGVVGPHVLVVWSVRGSDPAQRLRYARSTDGGLTYSDQGWLRNLPPGWRWGVDPCIAIDPVNANVFIAAQAANPTASQQGIALLTGSLNGGILQWYTTQIVRTTTWAGVYLGDNLSMNYDANSLSLDLVFHDGWASPPVTTHQVSHDNGANWSAPVVVATGTSANDAGQAPRVAYNYFFGPIVMYRDNLSPDVFGYRTRRWMSPPNAFDSPVSLAERRMASSSLPGTVADFFTGHTIAADHTPYLFQGRLYAAWVAGNAFSSNPIPPGGSTGELEPNDTQAQATLIPPGNGYYFSIFSPATDVDWYSMSLAVGEHVVIHLSGMQLTGTQGVITVATWTPDGLHDLGAGSFNSATPGNSIQFTAPRAGTYAFRVSGVNVSTYQLSFARANQEPLLGLDRRDLYTSFSTDFGLTWSSPARLGTTPGFDVANPQLVVGNDGRPYLFHEDFEAGHPDGATSVLRVTRSSDGGVTWESPVTLTTMASDWQPYPIVAGAPYKIGWRIGAATMLPYASELATGAHPARAEHVAAEEINQCMVAVWSDARDGETNLYGTGFSTGFDIPFRATDTTATPGTTVGLRAIMQNRNTLFPVRVDPLPATCQRNWSSVQATFFLDPGETRSFWPIAVNVPDTAAAGDVFFQGAFTIGPNNYGINVMIHVVPAVGVGDDPRAIAFRASGPNPASERTSFAFAMPADADASLEVFDVTGARVRTLVAGRVAAGAHEKRWDLSDDAGRRVGTGLYLARLTIGGWSSTRRITVVR